MLLNIGRGVRKVVLLVSIAAAIVISALPATGVSASGSMGQQARSAGSPQQPNATCADGQCFADVPASNDFFEFINRIYQQDLVSGYACGGPGEPCDAANRPYYRPGNGVTRQQMAKFIDNARRLPQIYIETDAVSTPPIYARNVSGIGIVASSESGQGLSGASVSGTGIGASSGSGQALSAVSGSGTGIYAQTGGANASGISIYATGSSSLGLNATTLATSGGDAVRGTANCSTCNGVRGNSTAGIGVYGSSTQSFAVRGENLAAGGNNSMGGVHGNATCTLCYGVKGDSTSGIAVQGTSASHIGVRGISNASNIGTGVDGLANCGTCRAVDGYSTNGIAIHGESSEGFAGKFSGNVHVNGTLSKSAGSFKIDHPVDPENKFLSHSFVESPDMMNVYNGNVTTDANGDATVTLPDWFEALNKDFRYQLTTVGQFAQTMVASEIKNNRFTIKTDKPNVKVSWQVTGIRHDPYAEAHRIPVEEKKIGSQVGKYLNPEEAGQPASKTLDLAIPAEGKTEK